MVKNFPSSYGTSRFVTVFTKTRYWILSWASLIQYATINHILLRSILIVSSHRRLGPNAIYLLYLTDLNLWAYSAQSTFREEKHGQIVSGRSETDWWLSYVTVTLSALFPVCRSSYFIQSERSAPHKFNMLPHARTLCYNNPNLSHL
jgi:hypothetical protein